jgi:succinate dehydrogenase / fumarate reductase flavoprotein subunit
VGPLHNSVYLDMTQAAASRQADLNEKYGNLFDVYRHTMGEDPLVTPMRIAPSAHFTMGGLWADFDLMTSLPGLFVGGEAGFSYHGANRLGANSLLSAGVDGWFTLPLSVASYLASHLGDALPALDDTGVTSAYTRAQNRLEALQSVGGHTTPAQFHARLGQIMYEHCGLNRSADGLRAGMAAVRALRAQFWDDVAVPGGGDHLNVALEKAGRVADFLELAELMCVDALDRDESCGAHFRVEHERDGEGVRDDVNWRFVSAWATGGERDYLTFTRHAEPLDFSVVPLVARSYA